MASRPQIDAYEQHLLAADKALQKAADELRLAQQELAALPRALREMHSPHEAALKTDRMLASARRDVKALATAIRERWPYRLRDYVIF